MSKKKIWNIIGSDADPSVISETAEKLGVSPITARLLYNRGYKTSGEALIFLRLQDELLHDPFLMKDMDKACERILSALDSRERIMIYGDYDVDGVTATSLMYLYLRQRGGDVSYYIPNRLGEGYGVNSDALKKIAEQGYGLIITVDTGITAVDEVRAASELGCDMIITDHHECHGDLPNAVAVVNPRRADCPYPFKELAGVGVAFKVVTALEFEYRKKSGNETRGFLSYMCDKYIDLVALGTVADVMPLCDENRLIVSMGLKAMEKGGRAGINSLIEAADGGKNRRGRKVTSSLVGYTLAPRINAAGRMRSAETAVKLFITEDKAEADEIAQQLCEANRQRQSEENKIIEEIEEMIAADPKCVEDPVIVLSSDGWHHGVIGIVASRVSEKYSRPSILVSFDGDIGKGSGRSIKGLNLVEALTECSDTLEKYGGHELAAGLTVTRENLGALKKGLCRYASEHLREEDYVISVDVDCEISAYDATLEQAEEICCLEPFGVSNTVPVFMMREVTVEEAISIGQGRHTKLVLSDGKPMQAVYFGMPQSKLGFTVGDRVDVIFNLNVNEFMGRRSEQLVIRDMRFAASQMEEIKRYSDEYRKTYADGGASQDNMPCRDDFVGAYLKLKRLLPEGSGEIYIGSLLRDLRSTPRGSGPINYVRLKLALDILAETNVISMIPLDTESEGLELYYITINNVENKVNLEKSCLYKKLMKRTQTPVSV